MNILFLTYQGGLAGSSLSISYLAKGLSERGHGIFVGCPEDAWLAGYFEGTDVTVIPMRFNGRMDFNNARHIAEVVKMYKIDVINAQSSLDRYTSIIAKKFFGAKAKLVFTRRQVSKSMGGPQSWLYQWAADRFVAVSEGIRESLLKDGIRDENITVVYNGTPSSKYENVSTSSTEEIRARLNMRSNDFVIGCVSRLKNQIQILKAMELIEDPVTAVFVGISEVPGYEPQILEKKGHRVYFEGRLRAHEILPYYPLFSVKVLASTMEGLSQSLLESMYMKVPVIATAAAGNLDLIRDHENGLLFPDGDIRKLADCILQLKNNTELRKELITAGYKTASVDFSIENTLDGYEKLFTELSS